MYIVTLTVCLFFNGTATPDIYTYCHTLALHDALPIAGGPRPPPADRQARSTRPAWPAACRPARPAADEGHKGGTTGQAAPGPAGECRSRSAGDRKSTRLNSSH